MHNTVPPLRDCRLRKWTPNDILPFLNCYCRLPGITPLMNRIRPQSTRQAPNWFFPEGWPGSQESTAASISVVILNSAPVLLFCSYPPATSSTKKGISTVDPSSCKDSPSSCFGIRPSVHGKTTAQKPLARQFSLRCIWCFYNYAIKGVQDQQASFNKFYERSKTHNKLCNKFNLIPILIFYEFWTILYLIL